ncbi:MAG: metal-dependent hydrolase [Magnetococcales bacterium]|nr:metal-dependent hydrolase [Magnetococcales bacterium]
MDSITQGLLGAAVGQAGFRQKLGRKAIVWGAVIGSLPDLDILAKPIYGPFSSWLHHRGPTHSVFSCLFAGVIIGWLIHRYYQWRKQEDSSNQTAWIMLSILALVTHPLLDWMTTYGTQLLWPFTNHRFALDAIGIIDLPYSLVLFITLFFGLRKSTKPVNAMRLAQGGLLITSLWLGYGWHLNQMSYEKGSASLKSQGITYSRLNSYPTLITPFNHRIVAHNTDGKQIHIGFFDTIIENDIEWTTAHQADGSNLIDRFNDSDKMAIFRWFSDDQLLYQQSQESDGTTTISVTDLRYGMPLLNPLGIWGVRGRYDLQGNQVGSIHRYSTRGRPSWERIGQIFKQALGVKQEPM